MSVSDIVECVRACMFINRTALTKLCSLSLCAQETTTVSKTDQPSHGFVLFIAVMKEKKKTDTNSFDVMLQEKVSTSGSKVSTSAFM